MLRHTRAISILAISLGIFATTSVSRGQTTKSDDTAKLERRIKDLEAYVKDLERQLAEKDSKLVVPLPAIPRIAPQLPRMAPPAAARPAPPLLPEPFMKEQPDSGWHERQFNGRTVYVVPLRDKR